MLLLLSMMILQDYLSSDHPFQVYYKVRQLILLKVQWSVTIKCDKCYYKVRQFLLQSAIEQTLLLKRP